MVHPEWASFLLFLNMVRSTVSKRSTMVYPELVFSFFTTWFILNEQAFLSGGAPYFKWCHLNQGISIAVQEWEGEKATERQTKLEWGADEYLEVGIHILVHGSQE